MSQDPVFHKQGLRQRLHAVLADLPDKARREGSAQACERLRNQPVWKNARAVLFYAALPTEIDLSTVMIEALRDGKSVGLPRFSREIGAYEAVQIRDAARDCAPGKYGIMEPLTACPHLPLNQLDLVLAPGVGFDATGRRLGRGRGYYDRLLAQIRGIKCGVAFDQQIVGQIPGEHHDVHMNCILTPTRWLEISE
jgi:5-formyltetrahydrofolate cyclo-ligase